MFCHHGRQVSASALPIISAAPPNSTMVKASKVKVMRVLPSSVAAFQVRGAHLGVGEQIAAGAGEGDEAVDHDVAAMRQPQGVVRVLLDQEHGDLLALVDLLDDGEDLLDDQRREAERR